MSEAITTGNAAADGAAFGFWFMGDMERWAAKAGLAQQHFAQRQSRIVEMKWGAHRAGEGRNAWAPCSDRRTMSLLVRGRFLLRFRSPDNRDEIVERRLEREGDYAIWGSDVEHAWAVEEDTVIFTVRWEEQQKLRVEG